MKNNIEKIKKLRKELKEVVNEYNSIDSDFDLSSNVELLNEEAKELNQILGLLDKENSNLENRIEFLKEDVNKRIEKLASENPFKTILKKFQKIYGKDSFNVLDLNNFYDSQNEKNLVSNKNFSFKKTKNANQYFNTLFEQEIESIKNISSNKQDFILNNFDINTFSSLPKEEKLFYIFSKIDELKEKFQINLDFELAKNDSQGIDYHTDNLLINNILEVISNSYDELKNEFTKKISWDEFVENESNFNKGKTLFDMKTGNFKNLISNVEQLENKYRKRLSELFNSPVKNKFIDLINDQSLDFQNYQLQIKKLFESSYSTNYSLFKVKFDLSLNSYLKFIESIEVQVENIQNENSNFLSKNKESFLLAGKEKDLSIESAYNNELCEIAKKFILQVNLQQEIITNYSSKFLSWINSISYESDYDLVISKITNETKQSLQLAKDVFASLKKELKSEVKTLKQTLYINKESEIYLNSEQIIGLLTKGIDSSEKNLVNDLEECLEQIQDFFKDFLSKKYDLINEKLLATQNFEINNNKFPENILNNKLDSSLDKNDSNVLLISLFNKKIESLEEKFANFASVLENINNKLNKKDSEEADKNYIEEISKNINNKFEELLNNLKAEMNSVSENNHNFVSGLIENNNKEREYITDLLHKIDDEYQNTLDELELRRIAESNKKLQDLENLIVLQNQELQELLDDKNEVFNKIEQVVNSKAKNEKSSENLEKAIEQISKNFELKIDSLESKFNEKLEEINVNSMILSTTDNDLYREITRNISELENQLSSNYESVKNSFKENFTEIISKINSFGESSSHGELLNKKIEELNILLDNLKEKNEESLQNIAKNLKESSKKDMSEIIENFNDKLGFIGEKIESKVDWYETNRQEELNNLSEKLSSKLEHLITEKQEDNQRLVSSLIESNNKEREYIVNLLHKIDDEYQNTLDELELRRIAEGNKKLHDLENLIVLQNNELQELLDDKNEVFNQIEKAISKKASSYDNSVNLEKTILEISKNFESRIDSLESRFNEKLEEINVNSLTLSSTDNDLYREITRNISELESQLSNNYESVKNSFKENFSEIINKIEYGQQGGYSEILNRKIQELNILVDSLKSDNQESLQNITKNIDEASQRNVSQILDNLNEKIGSIGEKIENKVDWYETNRQEELSNLSEKISNRIESLIHDINIKQEDNQNLVFNLIESNNKERDYVVNLLNKIDSEYQSTLNELELKVIADGNRKIESLEGLIILQNNELQELLDDKNNVINEIENAINRKVNSQDSPVHLEKTILEISKNFESRIDNLESRFNDKLNEINVNSMVSSSTDNDLYREITRNIEILENQLVSNYESVKNSFKENFSEIIDKIGYGNQDAYNEVLNRKIDELNILVDSLKVENKESLENIAQNLKETSQKNISQIIENLDDKIGSISEKIENKVDWYETNRQEEFSNLSEKLNNRIEALINDINIKQQDNQNLVFSLIESNNKERDYVVNLLNKIDVEHQDTLGELEARIVADSNKKLETLEDLIILQNNELEELLDDKNNVINEIEKAISRKVKNQDNNPIHLEKTILEISKNFESRIDNLESRFNDKLQEIHVDSLTLASTDNDLYREITRNIEILENQLVSNYESVKNSFKENFSEIIDKIGYGNQDSYNESLNRKIDELNILVDNLKEKNDQHIQNFQDFKESSKKDVSEMFDAFSDKLDSIGQEIGSKVDWYENNRQEELDNLAEKFDSKIENLINDINETTEINQQLVSELIEKNNKEKDYIISFLHKIDAAHQDTLNELEAKIISESNKKIEALEDLIILQNNELEELLDDKNSVIDQIEKIISKKEKSQDNNPIHLEKTILEISKNFESRIDNLESRFNDKLNEINVNSLVLASTDNDLYREITRNIEGLESQLVNNYESVKNSFKESFAEIIDKIGYGNQGNYNEILSRKIDELNVLVDNLKENNEISLQNLEENLKNSSKKDISEMFENFNNRLGSVSEEISRKVDWYENNRQEELNNLSEKISSQLKYLINDIHNERLEDNQRFVDQIIKNNENEKQYILSLLNKIDEERNNSVNEQDLSRILENNRRMQILEELILVQNNELQELLDDKNNAINEIENVILRNKDRLVKKGESAELKEDISKIIEKFDNKIINLESKLEEKFSKLSNFSDGLDGMVSKEISKSMSELENKLIENYESIKNSFKESFHDIENWVLSITDKENYDDSPKFDQILDAINDLKNSTINFNPDEFCENITGTLLNELNKFSLNQFSLFENLEKNILSAIDKNVFESIMDDFDYRLKELISQISSKNAENLKEIEDKLILSNDELKSASKADREFVNKKLNQTLDSYQSLLEKSLEIVNNNYLNLKDLVQKVLDRDREELTASELKKIVSLESKFSNLEKLVVLQDEQTSALLNEKENLLAKLISILKEDTKDFDDVLKIISVIDEKIKNFNELISENLEISKDISEGNVFNETSQISDRVDALSQYLKTVSENLYTLNFDYENIWMLDEIKNFGNLEFIHRKLNSLTDEIQSINNSSCNDSQIIKKLDQIKLDLLSIESDLKLIRISVDSNSESNIKEFNIKKSNFISNLIKENKILINNLLKEKENLVKNITEKAVIDNNISELQKNNLEILLEGKAGIIFEIIFKEIQKIQEQNISNFNTKLNELKNQLTNNLNSNNDTNCDPYAFVVDKKLLDKIENIENNIHSIFNQIDEKKNNFLNGLESKVGNNDLVEKIINKFDKEKESLAEIHQRKRNELKDLIINFKNKELESYRKKLNSLESEIKNLKESNSSNDKNFLDFENDIDQEQEKLSLLEDLIENLTLEINSFDEEKIAMFNEMENKINYLDDLNNPLKEGLIELESDNWNSDKFKKIVSKETQEIINSKFQGLKKDCDFNIQKIESTLKDLKNIHSQLSEIDKKLSDNTTLDERMGDLENLVFEPIKKADVENNNKITNYHLKLIDDNIKFYVDELEKKKIEIANFYRKVRNLTINREKKVEE